ncbi:MAG: diguanylate cyclase [Candidatus Riflebacteria bacterium]|nr:diguanylate cyclase [Candidatus Riflebacteria bacterium]
MDQVIKPDADQLQQQVLRYEYVLGALSDIGGELCRVTGFDVQLKSLLHLILGTLGVSRGGIFLFNSNDDTLTLRCSWKLSKKEFQISLSKEEIASLENSGEITTFPIHDFPHLPIIKESFPTDDLFGISILKVREKFIGILAIGNKLKKEPFSEKEISFLTTLSRNVAVAINNFFLLSELRETNKQLDEKIKEVSILYQATQMIASELQLQSLLDMAMNATSEISKVTDGSIWLFDDEQQKFILKSHLGGTSFPESISLENHDILNEILSKGEILISNPPQSEFEKTVFGDSFIMIPIMHQGEFLGMMHLREKSPGSEFPERDQKLIRVFALQLGVAVKNAKLYEQAITDGMTHLYLHRYFKTRLFDEIKRAERFKRHLALIMMDIDHFKKFNDNYGHQMGDEVLKRVASIMRKALRTHDIPVRYGGEEFAIVLPETELNGALAVAERIRRMIESDDLEMLEKRVKITCSMGVSVYPENAKCMETLIKAADQALYDSKRNGRNQVTPAPPESLEI